MVRTYGTLAYDDEAGTLVIGDEEYAVVCNAEGDMEFIDASGEPLPWSPEVAELVIGATRAGVFDPPKGAESGAPTCGEQRRL